MKYKVTIKRKDGEATYWVAFSAMESFRRQFEITTERSLLANVCLEEKGMTVTGAEYFGTMSLSGLRQELGVVDFRYELKGDTETGRVVTVEKERSNRCTGYVGGEYHPESIRRAFDRVKQTLSVDTEAQDLGDADG
jgi:hypothetical protein